MKPDDMDYVTCGGCGVTKHGMMVNLMVWAIEHQLKCKKLKDKVARIRLT